MKKLFLIIIFAVLVSLFFIRGVLATENLKLYFFTAEGCPHCAAEREYLKSLEKAYDFSVEEYEINKNKDNLQLLKKFIKAYELKNVSAPLLFLGDDYFVGFDKDITGPKIKKKIEFYIQNPCADPLKELDEKIKCRTEEEKEEIIRLPFIGKINLYEYSLPAITVILGLVDGFNPCAMWVLLALLTLLISVGDRKRIWLVGGLFILVTGFIYFSFMAAWLNVFLWLGFLKIIRVIVALVAVGAGIWYLKSFVTFKEGVCEVTSEKQEKRISERIQTLIKQSSILAIITGVIILAFTVNMIELLCTVGSRLIGGILMIILGILLLLKPELLMFK